MTLTKNPVSRNRRFSPRNLFETCMALLVLCNYILVIFDLTYIPLRDFWLQGRLQITLLRFNEPIKLGPISFQELQIPPDKPLEIPFVKGIAKYDVVKGIKPYRSTSEYLATVDKLNELINQKVFNPEFNLQEYRQEIEKILDNLRQKSVNMIDNNPFALAEKTGTLEKIKNKTRLRVFQTENVANALTLTDQDLDDIATKLS